jgi:hypothetical protein
MLFTKSHGRMPMIQTFVAGRAWKELRLRVTGFAGTDGKDVMGVLFAGGPGAGKFALDLDQVELRP